MAAGIKADLKTTARIQESELVNILNWSIFLIFFALLGARRESLPCWSGLSISSAHVRVVNRPFTPAVSWDYKFGVKSPRHWERVTANKLLCSGCFFLVILLGNPVEGPSLKPSLGSSRNAGWILWWPMAKIPQADVGSAPKSASIFCGLAWQ